MAKMFNSTFQLLLVLDPTLEQDNYIHISKQDRKMMKMLYKLYNIKKHTKSYDVFEGMVLKQAADMSMLPINVAEIICEKLSKL